MFFFQDDIGILIQLSHFPFWKFIFTPVSANFAPLMQLVYEAEYFLFGLSFPYYVGVSVLFHCCNCILIYYLAKRLLHSRIGAMICTSLFAINLTYTEPLLWVASQGILPATFFLGLALYYWLDFIESNRNKFLYISVVFTICSGFFYSLGTGIGIVFAAATLFYRRNSIVRYPYPTLLYTFTAIGSYLIGPLFLQGYARQVLPAMHSPVKELGQYGAFVIAGVSRGIIGRFFLPGFDPSHTQKVLTVLSFLPAFGISCALCIYIWKRGIRQSRMIIILGMFILASYIWPGFIRYHFGLKQALAERYAYHGLFFFSLLIGFLILWSKEHRYIRSNFIITIAIVILGSVQTFFFIRNAVLFEVRPLQTKEYFVHLRYMFTQESVVVDLPLPSYINQQYRISDVEALLQPLHRILFIREEQEICSPAVISSLQHPHTGAFYLSQHIDLHVYASTASKKLYLCLINNMIQ